MTHRRVGLASLMLAGLLIGVLVPRAEAVTILTLQDGFGAGPYAGTRDTFLNEDGQDEDHGTDTELELRDKSAKREVPLIFFDLTGQIPAGQDILSAVLTLEKEAGSTSNLTVTAYRVTAGAWSEGDGNDSTAGHADWNHRIHSSTTWPGGDFSSAAYTTTDSASTVVSADGTYNWTVTDIVEPWYLGTNPNYGFALVGSSGHDKTIKFWSSEQTTSSLPSSLRPKLTITYQALGGGGAGTIVPEPMSLLLVGLGGLGMFGARLTGRRSA